MSFFCWHAWGKKSAPKAGFRTQKCRKCGTTRRLKVSTFWCNHRWKLQGRRITKVKNGSPRRGVPKTFICTRCAAVRSR